MIRSFKLFTILPFFIYAEGTPKMSEHLASLSPFVGKTYKGELLHSTEDNPVYVQSWKETIEVPCETTPTYNPDPHPNVGHQSNRPTYRRHVTVYEDVDTNDCSEGTIAGGLLGGGLAGFGSRGKDRWWAIPAGIIGGSMVGCAMDGG